MGIEMVKFGALLNGRPAAREAVLRLRAIINGSTEDIVLDFAGVEILTPSFADELLHALREKYGTKKIKIANVETAVVKDTLKAIETEPAHT